jgi:hypothetical protein
VFRFDNVRLDKRNRQICSVFIERFMTSNEVVLYTTGSGKPVPIFNNFVVGMSTNEGSVSEDLLNRSVRSKLSPKGNVAERVSPIGDPRWEYLPENRLSIQAELLGIVARWNSAGRQLATATKHTFKQWSQEVGGMLELAGFNSFLANHAEQRVANDPVRDLVAFLGLQLPGKSLRTEKWLEVAERQGIADDIIPAGHQHGRKRRVSGLGLTLTRYANETFSTSTEDELVTLRLHRERRRLHPGTDAKVVYRYEVVDRKPAVD